MASRYQSLFDQADSLDNGDSTSASDPLTPYSIIPDQPTATPPAPKSPYQDLFDQADSLDEQKPENQSDQPYTDRALTALEKLHRINKGLPPTPTPQEQQQSAQSQPQDWSTGVASQTLPFGFIDTGDGQMMNVRTGVKIPFQGEQRVYGEPLPAQKMARTAVETGLSYGPPIFLARKFGSQAVKDVTEGAIKGVGGTVEGLTSPENLAMLAAFAAFPEAGIGAVASKGVSAYFAADMAEQLPELWRQFKQAPDLKTKTEIAIQGMTTLGFGLAAAKHAGSPDEPMFVTKMREGAEAKIAAREAPPGTPVSPASPEIPGAGGPRFRSTVTPGGGGKSAEQPGDVKVQTPSTTQREQEGTGGAGPPASDSDTDVGKEEGAPEQGGVSSPAGPIQVGDKITYGGGKGVTWEVKGGNKLTTRIFNPETNNTVVLKNDDLQRKIDSGNIVHNPAEEAPAASPEVNKAREEAGIGALPKKAVGAAIQMDDGRKFVSPFHSEAVTQAMDAGYTEADLGKATRGFVDKNGDFFTVKNFTTVPKPEAAPPRGTPGYEPTDEDIRVAAAPGEPRQDTIDRLKQHNKQMIAGFRADNEKLLAQLKGDGADILQIHTDATGLTEGQFNNRLRRLINSGKFPKVESQIAPDSVKKNAREVLSDVQQRMAGQGTTEAETDMQNIVEALEKPEKFSLDELKGIRDKAAATLDTIQKGAGPHAHPHETRIQLAVGSLDAIVRAREAKPQAAKPFLPMGPKEEPPRVRPPAKSEPPVEQPAEEPAHEPAPEPAAPGTEAPGITPREKEIAKAAAPHVDIGVPQDHAIAMETHPIDRGLVDNDRIKQQMALDKIEKSKATAAQQERADRIKADAEAKAKAEADKAAEEKAKAEEEFQTHEQRSGSKPQISAKEAGVDEGKLEASYSGDKIQDGKIKKPVKIGEKLYVATGTSWRGDYPDGERVHDLVEVVPADQFKGPTTTYSDKVYRHPDEPPSKFGKDIPSSGEAARRDPNGFYYGMKVKHGGKDYVMGRPFEREPTSKERTKARKEAREKLADKRQGPEREPFLEINKKLTKAEKEELHDLLLNPQKNPKRAEALQLRHQTSTSAMKTVHEITAGDRGRINTEVLTKNPKLSYYERQFLSSFHLDELRTTGKQPEVRGTGKAGPTGKFDEPFQVMEHKGYQISRYRKPDGGVRMVIEKDGRTIGEVKENQFFDARQRIDQMVKAKEITHQPEAPIVELDRVSRQLFKKGYNDLGPVQQEQVRNSPQYFHGPDYDELQKISQELFKKDIGQLGPRSMERKMVDAELRRRKGEPEPVAYKPDDLVQYKVNGKVQGTTGVIDKVLPDGRLVVQPVGGGDAHTIRPEDVVSHRPHVEPKPVKMPKAKTSGVLRSRQTASGWEYTKGGYKVTTVELPDGRIAANLFKGKTLKGSKTVGSDAEAAVWARENLNNPEAATHEVSAPTGKPRKVYEIEEDLHRAKMDLLNAKPSDQGPIQAKIKGLEQEFKAALNQKDQVALMTPSESDQLNKISQDKYKKPYNKLSDRQKDKVNRIFESPGLFHRSIDPDSGRRYSFSDEVRTEVKPNPESEPGIEDIFDYSKKRYGQTLEQVVLPEVGEFGGSTGPARLRDLGSTEALAAKFNRPVELFRSTDGRPARIDGFEHNGKIFLDVNMIEEPVVHIASHEITHWIESAHPQLYSELIDALKNQREDAPFWEKLKRRDYSDAAARHEHAAEFVAELLRDRTRMDQMLGKDPSLIRRVVTAIRDWITDTIHKFGTGKQDESAMGAVRDLGAARDKVMGILDRVTAREESKGPPPEGARFHIRDEDHLQREGGKSFEENRTTVRNPWHGKATEDPSKGVLEMNMDGIYANDRSMSKIAKKYRKWLPRDLWKGKDPRTIIQNAVRFFRDNSVRHWKMLDRHEWGERAKDAYAGYNIHGNRLGNKYKKFGPEKVFTAESAMSPRRPPDESFSMVERVMRAMTEAGNTRWDDRFTRLARSQAGAPTRYFINQLKGKKWTELKTPLQKAVWLRVYDSLHHDPYVRAIQPEGNMGDWVRNSDGTRKRLVPPTDVNIAKGIQVLEGSEPTWKLLTTPKVSSYNNAKSAPLAINRDYVSDTHDVAKNFFNALTINDAQIKYHFGGFSDGMHGIKGTYPIHQEAGLQGAERVGEANPKRFQSGTWHNQQAWMSGSAFGHTLEGKKAVADIKDVMKAANRGEISSSEAVRKAASIADAFHKARGGVTAPDWVRDFNPAHQIEPAELSRPGSAGATGPQLTDKAEALPKAGGTAAEPGRGGRAGAPGGTPKEPKLSIRESIPGDQPENAKARFEAWKEFAGKNKLDVNDMPAFQKWMDTAQSTYTGYDRPRGKLAKLNPFTILKNVYAAAQKAGEAGFKRGTVEERQMADYELQYQASQHRQQMAAERKAGLDALGELRRQFQTADSWMAADQQKVAKQMTEFVETVLPRAERGDFIKRITAAMRRPPLGRGKVSDPVIMHERAFKVMRDIEDRAIEVYKRDIISDVKETLKKSIDAPGIDVTYRRRLKQTLNSISLVNPSKGTLRRLQKMQDHINKMTAAGKDPGIPQAHLDELKRLTQLPLKDMPVGALEALQENIHTTIGLGRLKARMLKARWDTTKENAIKELNQQPSMPLEERPIYTAQPTEKLTTAERFFNAVNKTMNTRSYAETAISPMDEIYDHMDGALGTYNGWTSRHFKGQLDLAFNAREAEHQPIVQASNELIKRHNLNLDDMHTIQMKAIMNMKDVGRQRLEAMGVRKDILDRTEAKPLTPGQQAYYNFIRKHYDAIGPRISDVAHQLYQMDMIPVENYVPLERDWAAHMKGVEPKPMADPSLGEVPFNETATMDQLQRDVNPLKVSRTEQGFLKERVPEAKTPVKLNAEEVFIRHMRDALHFIHAQPVLKMLGEIAREEGVAKDGTKTGFKAKYGKLAQNIVLDHLDTIANNGYVDQRSRWRGLDWVRNSTSKAAIGFRLASGIVHTSQIPLAWAHAGGPHWWLYGLHKAMTKEGQLFLRRHGAETFVRGGGEVSQVEAAEKSGPIGRASFYLPRIIDKFNAQATFLGRYAKEMHDKGVSMDGLLSKPVAADAQALALRRMHRAVASPLAKDIPQLTSRGKGFGGNVSVARAVNQFKNIFLDNWSAIRHDILRVGVKDASDIIRLMRGGEFAQGAKRVGDAGLHRSAIALAMIAGVAIETGIKLYTQKALAAGAHKLTGVAPPPEQSKTEDEKTYLGEFKHHALNRIPFVGQVASAMMYGGTGIPVADAIIDVAKEPYLAISKSKKPETRAKHFVRAASAAATAAGIPGSTQALQLAEPWLAHHLGKMLPAYQSTRTGRPSALRPSPYPGGGKGKVSPYPTGKKAYPFPGAHHR